MECLELCFYLFVICVFLMNRMCGCVCFKLSYVFLMNGLSGSVFLFIYYVFLMNRMSGSVFLFICYFSYEWNVWKCVFITC